MKISVIVPVHNAARYLRQCVESILAQTVCDLELILVDDGSTDASPTICDSYARLDRRVRVIHTPNAGVSAARNKGIDSARGEFIAFADADDAMPPRAFATLLDLFTPEVDITVGAFVHAKRWKAERHIVTHILSADEAIIRTLRQTGYDNTPCARLYRRRLFDDGTRFVEGIRYEDLDFFRRIYSRARQIAYTTETVYLYRTNDNSFINTWTPSRLDALAVTSNIEQWAATQHMPRLLAAARDRRFSANFNMFVLLCKNTDTPERTDLIDRTWSVIAERRREVLFSSEARLKNRLGAAISYLGKNISKAIAHLS